MKTIDRLIAAAKTQDQPLGPALTHPHPLIQSAVLIPCFQMPDSERFELLLTVRQQGLSSHAGQVCFPGGRYDAALDQSFTETALRECYEETSIPKENIDVLGSYGYLDTITGYRIYPYIGWVNNRTSKLLMNEAEISDHFFVPLETVLDISTYSQTNRNFNNQVFSSYWFEYSGYRIWGATARILYSLAQTFSD